MWSAFWALKWSCLPLSPVVSLHVGGGCWLVWPPSWALKWSCLPLSPFMWGVGVGWCGRIYCFGVAASRTKTCRNQNHRFQSKFAYCKLFGVYAGVIFKLGNMTPQMMLVMLKRSIPEFLLCGHVTWLVAGQRFGCVSGLLAWCPCH